MTALEDLDPRLLDAHPRNARTDLGDLTGLAASIAAQGVIEPLTVFPTPDGRHTVVAGHRRRAAAIEAGVDTVPCVVRPDLADISDAGQVEHLGAMLAENVHRQNLTAVEEGRAVQQMLDLGLPLAKVAARTGLTKKHVAKAAGVALLDEDTAAAVTGGALTLDQAAVVAGYREDPDVAGQLVDAATQGPGAFVHAVTRAKQDKDRRKAYLAKTGELRATGRTLVDGHEWNGPSNRRVTSLFDANGDRLQDDAHLSCPGSAVHVEDGWNGPHPVEVCTDWRGNGHNEGKHDGATSSPRPLAAELPPEQREAAKVERRQLIEDNKAMAAANTTRREWIRTVLLERRRGEKDVLRFAVEAITARTGEIAAWLNSYQPQDAEPVYAELGLLPPWRKPGPGLVTRSTLTNGEVVADARLPLQLLGHVAGAIESQIPKDAHRWSDHRRGQLATWLRFLTDQGYGLAEIEQRLVDAAAHRGQA